MLIGVDLPVSTPSTLTGAPEGNDVTFKLPFAAKAEPAASTRTAGTAAANRVFRIGRLLRVTRGGVVSPARKEVMVARRSGVSRMLADRRAPFNEPPERRSGEEALAHGQAESVAMSES
jgi:hypothetical protein